MKFELKRKEIAPRFKDVKVGETFVILEEFLSGYVFIKLATEQCLLTDEKSNQINAFNLMRNECEFINELANVRIVKGTFVEEGVNND